MLDSAQARSCCEETRQMLQENRLDRFDLARAALPNLHLILWTLGELIEESPRQEDSDRLRANLQRLHHDFTALERSAVRLDREELVAAVNRLLDPTCELIDRLDQAEYERIIGTEASRRTG